MIVLRKRIVTFYVGWDVLISTMSGKADAQTVVRRNIISKGIKLDIFVIWSRLVILCLWRNVVFWESEKRVEKLEKRKFVKYAGIAYFLCMKVC